MAASAGFFHLMILVIPLISTVHIHPSAHLIDIVDFHPFYLLDTVNLFDTVHLICTLNLHAVHQQKNSSSSSSKKTATDSTYTNYV